MTNSRFQSKERSVKRHEAVVLACFILTFLAFSLAGRSGWAEDQTLLIGDQKVLKFPSLKRVSIADPNIADVRVIGNNQVMILGKGEGATNLIVWDINDEKTTITIRVLSRDPQVVKQEIQDLLGPIEGVQVKTIGDKVILDGTVLKDTDLERVKKVAEIYQGQVLNFVRVSPNVNKLVVEQINRALRDAGLKGAVARAQGSSIFLEGSVATEKEGKKALEIATSISKEVTNLLNVGIAYDNLILMDVKVIEIRTSAARELGFSWPASIGGGTTTGTSRFFTSSGQIVELDATDNPTGVFVGGLYNTENSSSDIPLQANLQLNYVLPVTINTLISDGIIRILSNPTVVCRNGGRATWFVGGEFPIPIQNQLGGVDVEFKQYGIKIEFQPKTDNADNILTVMKIEVSDIDESVTVQGIPGLITRTVETQLNLRKGQTIALSGLLANTSGKSVQKFPILGQIPILGELFKTRGFTDNQTEVMVMVTPELTHSADPKNEKTLKEWKKRYEQAGNDLDFSILD
ncbi:MAG: hypothetical protein D6795_09285 [Deltaproteobacteria bacterium]|nr:MAG: hypothetical protein D6795_09285 [Deltaproteobacteria bacterium]